MLRDLTSTISHSLTKVWLLDEPLSNLDAKLRVYMRAELRKLQKTLKISTIYVTHDQVEALSMADRIAVVNEGKVLQIGTPDELYTRPGKIFVATFIGNPPMNVIECVLRERERVCTSLNALVLGDLLKDIWARILRRD